MTQEEIAVEVLKNEILKAVKNLSPTGDRTFKSRVTALLKDRYTIIDEFGAARNVPCAIPSSDLKAGRNVWVKIPCGDLSKMHICGFA